MLDVNSFESGKCKRKIVMKFTVKETVSAPADKVWEIVGANFNDISEWASPVLTSKANPDLASGEKGRICDVKGVGQVFETIQNYDDNKRELTFTFVAKKLPFFIKNVESTWGVKELGSNQTEVSTTGDVTLMPVFSQLMGGMLRKMMSKQTSSIQGELKYFVENGHAKDANVQAANA